MKKTMNIAIFAVLLSPAFVVEASVADRLPTADYLPAPSVSDAQLQPVAVVVARPVVIARSSARSSSSRSSSRPSYRSSSSSSRYSSSWYNSSSSCTEKERKEQKC